MQTGLSSIEAKARLEQHGPNALRAAEVTPWWRIFLRQFTNILIVILIVAALIAGVVGDLIDSFVILAIVVLNGALGFVQEWRAERSLEALKSMLTEEAVVVRDDREQRIDARLLVPGDLVMLEAGSRVPADMRITRSLELRVDESVLTGESVPVSKTVEGDEASDLTFMGTSVVNGRGKGVVEQTGMQTRFGRIAEMTTSVGEKQTNLQLKLGRLGRNLGIAAILIALLTFAVGYFSGRDPLELFMTGIALAVAIVPEGLPAVVTVVLAIGAAAMVRHNALSRRLQATETLGAATVICTDKTGTLTENQMTVTDIWLPSGALKATGTGYDPAGHFEVDGARIDHKAHADLTRILETALLCNNAHIAQVGPEWQMLGDPTEGALVTLAYKGWIALPAAGDILHEIPFSSERKRMSVVAKRGGEAAVHVKGAPESLLPLCQNYIADGQEHPLKGAISAKIEGAYKSMAGQGLRVLALARRSGQPDSFAADELEGGLTFLGLVGIIDPPRPEVRRAIAEAQSAGIKVVMITGDGGDTALAIAGQLGLSSKTSVSGDRLENWSDERLAEALAQGVVFSRSAPRHKMRIVELLQAQGHIVAMTGDGVNDAPALKRANIGIAMGIRGTDVAKDASDMVLLDDNFASIVSAIREGRRQFDNIQKFVRYLLASNIGEVIAVFANILMGASLIFLPTQILWMNLVTDGVTALALGLEKTEDDTMARPPRKPNEDIIGRGGLLMILAMGLYMAGASLYLFHTLNETGLEIAQTAAFTGMAVFEIFGVLAFRSFRLPMYRIGWLSNPALLAAMGLMLLAQMAAIYWPPLQMLLHTVPISFEVWQTIGLLVLPILIVPELIKFAMQSRRGAK